MENVSVLGKMQEGDSSGNREFFKKLAWNTGIAAAVGATAGLGAALLQRQSVALYVASMGVNAGLVASLFFGCEEVLARQKGAHDVFTYTGSGYIIGGLANGLHGGFQRGLFGAGIFGGLAAVGYLVLHEVEQLDTIIEKTRPFAKAPPRVAAEGATPPPPPEVVHQNHQDWSQRWRWLPIRKLSPEEAAEVKKRAATGAGSSSIPPLAPEDAAEITTQAPPSHGTASP